jgi:GPN-loop GTPase
MSSQDPIYVYFIGTAGSGKSTLAANFKKWMQLRGLDAITVNLDPGAEHLPYDPDIDIRDWISLEEIMETNELGPNGAQVVCADMIALNTSDVQESIGTFKPDYILMDTPGQLELFVFREAGKYTIQFLSPCNAAVCYLLDPLLARTASGFVSQLLLSLTTHFRLDQPQVNVLSKADVLSKKELHLVQTWSDDPNELETALMTEQASVYREMSEGILQLLKDVGGYTKLLASSKDNLQGIEDIYTRLQMQFQGGEDLMKD